MMPSRGLLAGKSQAARLFQPQCRNFSSARSRLQRIPRGHTVLLPISGFKFRQTVLPASALASLRFASTTVAPPAAAAEPAASATPITDAFPHLDTITLDKADIANFSEKIGYLHDIGLNYGWGPTSILEWTIEHLHVYGGLPWWGSIAATAVLLRLVMFPLYLKSSDTMARQQALSSITKPITDRMSAARKEGNSQQVMLAYQQLSAVRKKAGIRMRDQFAPMLIQAVFGYCGFKLARAMAALPVPALLNEGPLWLTDLTVSDPYLILPVVMASSMHLLVRMGGESGSMDSNQMNQTMRKVMLWGMPGIILITTGYLPATVNVWFAAGGALAIGQTLLLRRPAVRKFFKIAPIYAPKPKEADKGMLNAFLEPKNTSVGKTITVNATAVKSGSKPAPAAGKNDSLMQPKYQPPAKRGWQTPKLKKTNSKGLLNEVVGVRIEKPLAPESQPSGPTQGVPSQSRAQILENQSKAASSTKGKSPTTAGQKPRSKR